MGEKIHKRHFDHERVVLVEETDLAPTQTITVTHTATHCPSFDDEPWRSRAQALRPATLDYYTQDLATQSVATAPAPVPRGHPYVKLLLEFLDTVPNECWIDEENEVD